MCDRVTIRQMNACAANTGEERGGRGVVLEKEIKNNKHDARRNEAFGAQKTVKRVRLRSYPIDSGLGDGLRVMGALLLSVLRNPECSSPVFFCWKNQENVQTGDELHSVEESIWKPMNGTAA